MKRSTIVTAALFMTLAPLAMANATKFGLSSSIYTESRGDIRRFKDEIRAGMASINNGTSGTEAHVPYGGMGWSGNGTREIGPWALDAYTRWFAVNDDSSQGLQLAQIDTDYGVKHKYEVSNWDKL